MDDVKSSWPLRVGLHTCYNGGDNGLIPKSHLSSDWGLQLDPMKSELLVIANQHVAVNTFPGLVHTARHTMGIGSTRRRCANLARGSPQGQGQKCPKDTKVSKTETVALLHCIVFRVQQ